MSHSISSESLQEASMLPAELKCGREDFKPVVPSRPETMPLSCAQQRLWFLCQIEGVSEALHTSFGRRLKGNLDRPALRRALDRIVARHEVLRTTFAVVEGELVQRIQAVEQARFELREEDLRERGETSEELSRRIEEEAGRAFDLAKGPLIRGQLLQVAEDEHIMVITMHHIVSDEWSMGIFLNELNTLYGAYKEGQADPLPELEVQYADYAVWQRQLMEGEMLQQQAEYWKGALAGAPALLELPWDHARPAQQNYSGGLSHLELEETLFIGLKELSRRHGATLFMTLLAGWAALMGRLSGQEEVVIGVPVANRGRVEIEKLIGFFVNTLAVRVNVSGSQTVGELLEGVKRQALSAQEHQDLPFERVVEIIGPERSLSHTPLFNVMFAWQNGVEGKLEFPGVKIEALPTVGPVKAKFDLTLSLQETGERITGGVEYATALFKATTIERYLGYFSKLLAAMVDAENHRLDTIELLGESELEQVLFEWNETEAKYPKDKCIQELFEEQVEKTPDAVAVAYGDEELTYGELNRRANQLAHHLRGLGVRPDELVAICVERGMEMLVGLLGILKAGGAYVPLDPAYPLERQRFMLEDSDPMVLLTQSHLASRFSELLATLPVLDLNNDEAQWKDLPDSNPSPDSIGLTPNHMAYIIYTSGSTGVPKGVMIEHHSAVTLLQWAGEVYSRGELGGVLASTSICFDVSVYEIFVTLVHGGRILLVGNALELVNLPNKESVTLLSTVPSAMEELVRLGAIPDCVQTINLAGEPLPSALVDKIYDNSSVKRVYDLYGPTEDTTYSTYILRQKNARSSIGRPIANTQIYILDQHHRVQPIGVAGELHIAGDGLARGYLNRGGLTPEKFIANPFHAGTRMYKTGDRACWLEDGTIQYLGRIDTQVKIHGIRIELGEIEACLAAHPQVREAVVIAREDAPGDKRLVAYYTETAALNQTDVGAEELRAFLQGSLPEYMVPAAYVRLESLPLTPNGKLDRKGLPKPDSSAYIRRRYEAPQGEMETAVAAIWAEVLKLEHVGRWDNFFELGGHSLLAVRILSRVQSLLGKQMKLSDLFAYPVLAELVRKLWTAGRWELPPVTRTKRGEGVRLSFAQQRLWFLGQMEGGSEAYHVPLQIRMWGALDAGALRRALDRIVARHEVLRTIFAVVEGEPVQRIQAVEQARFELREEDLRERGERSEELWRRIEEEAGRAFDLERGPLIRGQLLQVAEDEHILMITMHHIVSDGWSMGIFLNELNTLYGTYREGQSDPLPELELQYADYAVWQRQLMEGEMLQQQAEYWKGALAGAPALLELPWDHARPAQQNYSGGLSRFELYETLLIGLKELSRRHGTTLFMTLLGGWAALMGRLSGQEEVVIGIPVANRGRVEIENLIGFFVNTLAVRVNVSGSQTVGELLEHTKRQALAAQQHQDIPFEQVVEVVNPPRSLAHSPLFQVMFAWQNVLEGRLEFPGVEIEVLQAASVRAKFDLNLSLQETSERITGGVEYATALFEPETIRRFVGYFGRLLEEMVADEAQPVEQIQLMSVEERRQVVHEWNTESEYLGERCLHELVEEQVARTPDAVALAYEDASLSYAALNSRANQLAYYLRDLGVKPDARVAICMERGLEMIVGVLAVLKAGGAYVPLGSDYPRERLGFILKDSLPVAVLTQGHLTSMFSDCSAGLPVLDLKNEEAPWRSLSESNLDSEVIGINPQNLAYVIYTSGSTGRPKGVLVEHRSVVKLFIGLRDSVYRSHATSILRVAMNGPLTFDTSVKQLIQLLQGSMLDIVPEEIRYDSTALLAFLRDRNVEVFDCTPSQLRFLLDADLLGEASASLERVLVGGEPIDQSMWKSMLDSSSTGFFNLYGPTECTVDACVCEVSSSLRPSIGRPIPNARVYILDRVGQPVPAGVTGELYIGGTGVARGYLNSVELTAERFVPDPYGGGTGVRMYRTGDLGCWRNDGNIELLGRNDFQVKVRGFRIELGEIEARLKEHPGIGQAVVMAREETAGDKRLVAYYTTALRSDAEPETFEAERLRSYLLASLPEYMVPAAYVPMERMPLTANGKLDRKALPAPDNDAFARQRYEAPQGEMETAVAAIWAEVLKLERVGRRDNFFELGGHSLLAVRVLSRVQSLLGKQMKLSDLFAYPVLAELVRKLWTAGRWDLPPVTRTERGEGVRLSFAQQRLWFLGQMEGGSEAYHIPLRRRLRGALDAGALRRAMDRIVARHEVLRTTFAVVEGEPVQRIQAVEQARFELREEDLRERGETTSEELSRRIEEEAGRAFDLTKGPLIRGQLLQVAEDEHVLVITMHHIVSDEWSMSIFLNELNTLYGAYKEGQADPLPELEVQYADYAVWQRQLMEGEKLQQQAEYWKSALAGAPALLELPWDHARPAQQNYSGGLSHLELEETLLMGLKELSRRHGATLFMTLLTGWAALMGRLSGQEEVVIGIPVANRGRVEIEKLIGFFLNTLALRVNVSGSQTVGELLERVKRDVLLGQEHKDVPFERVVEIIGPERSLSHTPLFNVMFAWQNGVEGRLEFPGVEIEALPTGSVKAKFDLALFLQEETSERITGGVEYATALFEATTIERYLGYFRRLLEGMVVDECQRVGQLSMLSETERQQLLKEWNDTAVEYPKEKCVHELFEEQVEKTPEAIAVVYEDQVMTYGELNRQANQLAHYLRKMGVKPDTRVGICVERGMEMMVGLLAVLKAGGAYVPLDPSYPLERLRYMLLDSEAKVLLTQSLLQEVYSGLSDRLAVLHLDAAMPPWRDRPLSNPEPLAICLTPHHLAYIIYTSGSTGSPKGVQIAHCALVNLLSSMQVEPGLESKDSLLAVTTISFDIAALELYLPLTVGARCVIASRETSSDPVLLAMMLEDEDIRVMQATPSTWKMLLESAWSGKPDLTVFCGGEALTKELAGQLLTKAHSVWNLYGPTETTVWSAVHRVTPAGGQVPIGRPIGNTKMYILDRNLQPVPVGVIGELHIGGLGLARGYLKRPHLDAEKFIASPFALDGRGQLYRTGDLARYRGDGCIECLGRIDHQVKVRGFRIELGEIEARLKEHPGIGQAVVMAREETAGDKRLVAYYTTALRSDAEPETFEAERLRSYLLASLPEYMVPAAYVPMERMPLTANGKLDRKALPAPESDAYVRQVYEAPQGEMETAVAAIWAEVLKLERVGRRDNFFELGGHSLLAIRVLSRVQSLLGKQMKLSDLFAYPVLAELVRKLWTAGRWDLPPVTRTERGEGVRLSFAQQRLWFLGQMEGGSEAYHISLRMRMRGALDAGALRRALDRIVARHEVLRTRFAVVEGEPVQRIQAVKQTRFELREEDLRERGETTSEELSRRIEEEAGRAFDLAKGPLIRGQLLQVAEDEHIMVITMHHIVSDEWSMGIFLNELNTLYGAYKEGQADPLPELDLQYADYAVWQRKWMEGDEISKAQARYWKKSLAGAPALLELPWDHARPAQQNYSGGLSHLELEEALLIGLKELSRRHGATLFMTLLGGWAALMGRLSGQEEVVIGVPVANRGRLEIEKLIGFFVNTLAVRVNVSGSQTVGELLEGVKRQASSAQEHQDLPFERVVEIIEPERSLSHTPLFNVMFAWQNGVEGKLEFPGVEIEPLAAESVTAKFDLALSLQETSERIRGGVEYATALFEATTIERYLGYFSKLLAAMIDGENQRLDTIELLGERELEQVLFEWNETEAKYRKDKFLQELFEEQVEKTPDAVAVVCGDEDLSYGELNRRANQLAHYLRKLGVKPDTRVGICVERGMEMMVGLLGILKAGGAYVPLDPAYPLERLRVMLEDSDPVALLTQNHLAARFPELLATLPVLDLSNGEAQWKDLPDSNLSSDSIGLTPNNLAYVIYTSGSTGTPKGVMIEHSGLANLVQWHCWAFGIGAGSHSSNVAGIGFDATICEVWPILCVGGTLFAPPSGTTIDPETLLSWWSGLDLDVSVLPTALAEFAFSRAIVSRSLGTLLVGGDHLRQFPPKGWNFSLVNVYGPTETTVAATTARLDEATSIVHIGRPIANTQVYILDCNGQPVPVGVAGELYIGGVGVGRGYLKRPELTAEVFVGDPFSGDGSRMYKTGDLGRWLGDGNIECLGRIDFQVKIRGFRVELGEIESRLVEYPDVREAVVIAREDTPGDKRLVAYYTTAPGGDAEQEAIEAERLRSYLLARLPEYMVPAAYVRLESLPLTPNGKLDRKGLPAPGRDAYAMSGYEGPVGETETTVAAIWAELLQLERVGRQDNFFHLGGHSLLATQVIARIRNVLQVELPLQALFESQTLASLAAVIEKARTGETTLEQKRKVERIERQERGEDMPLSFHEQGIYVMARHAPAYRSLASQMTIRLQGKLNLGALERSLQEIVERHEILRTRYGMKNGREVRILDPAWKVCAAPTEIGGVEREEQVRQAVIQEQTKPFDLEQGPLLRINLLKLGEQEHVLLLTMHHIITDGWSMSILSRELQTLYAGYVTGRRVCLPALKIQYADYAVWQRDRLRGEVFNRLLDYWMKRLGAVKNPARLRGDRLPGLSPSLRKEQIAFVMGKEVTERTRDLSRKQGVTPFIILLAIFKLWLYQNTAARDIAAVVPVSERNLFELEDMTGLLVNLVILHTQVREDLNFEEFLRQLHGVSQEAFAHQGLPFGIVYQALGNSDFSRVMFNYINVPDYELQLPGLKADPLFYYDETGASSWDVILMLREKSESIDCLLAFDADLFSKQRVAELSEQLQNLIVQVLQAPRKRLSQYSHTPMHYYAQI